jgi:hypothetical protein
VEGTPDFDQRVLVSRIVARYGKGREQPEVKVTWKRGEDEDEFTVPPFQEDGAFEALRV